jgi:hypothetical protein
MNLADALDTLFSNGDAAPLATLLLHRVQMEDGLALHIGRDAVIAEFLRVAAMFDGRATTLEASIDPGLVTLGWTGQLREFPSGNRLAIPVSATLRRHLWIEAEAGRAVRITAITDWAGLAGAAGVAQAPLAEDIGANHPTHRPLGELVSGRGQLATRPGDHVANLNARSLAGFIPDRRDWWLRLFARVPDAHLTLDRSVDDGFRTAILWRLQGHIAGRRISLPGTSIVDDRGESAVLFDELAVAAAAHRPFFAL